MHNFEKDVRNRGCCSVSFLRCILFLFNTMFLLAGFIILLTGFWSLFDPRLPIDIQTSPSLAAATFALIGVGGTVLFVGVLACVGVIKEVRTAVCVYAAFLVVLLIAEALVGFFAYLNEDKIYAELSVGLNSTFMDAYGIDQHRTESIDLLQREFKCCGAVRFEDWRNSRWLQDTKLNNTVPDSCCRSIVPFCGARDHPSNIHYDGCIHRLEKLIREHLVVVAAVILGVCLVQILTILFSFCLFVKLKKVKKDPF